MITGITVSNLSVVVAPTETMVGFITVTTTPDTIFNGTLSLSGASTGFNVVGTVLNADPNLVVGNYTFNIVATTDDLSEDPFSSQITVIVSSVAIIDISLSNNSVQGEAASGTIVGGIIATMNQGTSSGTFTIGGPSASLFQIIDDNLCTSGVVPPGQYAVTLTSSMEGVAPFTSAAISIFAAQTLAISFTGTLSLAPAPGTTLPPYFQIVGNDIVVVSAIPDPLTLGAALNLPMLVVATEAGAVGSPFQRQINVAVTPSNVTPSISSIGISNSTFTPGSPSGTVVGAITVATNAPAAFSGTLSVSGTNATSFQCLAGNLVTVGVLGAGAYSINIVATQAGAYTNSPFSQPLTVTATTVQSKIDPITYTISYGTSAVGPWTQAATGLTATSNILTSLTSGTHYYVQVTATDTFLGLTSAPTTAGPFNTTSSGESAQGTTLTTTTGSIIDASGASWSLANSPSPGGVTTVTHPTVTNTSISLSWTAPTGATGLEVRQPTGALFGSGVTLLLYFNHTVYFQNSAGFFYWNGTTWVATTDPRVVATESAQGVTVTNTTGVITDAIQGTWMLATSASSGLQVKHNGVVDTSTSNDTLLLYWNHLVYRQATAGWFNWNGTAWVSVVGDPRIVQSASGTTIPPTAQIVDASLIIWTLVGGQAARNGVIDATTSGVSLLLYYNSIVYQTTPTGSGLSTPGWWQYLGGLWNPVPGDPRVVASPDGATLNSATGAINDTSLNSWTLVAVAGSGLEVYENSAPAGFTANVILLLWYSGLIYQENNQNLWWSWTGTSWSQVTGDPRIGAGAGAVLLFRDDFNTLSLTNYVTGSVGTWRLGGRSYQPAGFSEGQMWEPTPFNPATPIQLGTVAGSVLQLQTVVTPANMSSAADNQPYMAAWMDTRDTHYFQGGYFEASIKVATVPGVGCAFWLQPQSGIWPPEIDIMEAAFTPVAAGGLVDQHNVWTLGQSALSNWFCYSGSAGSNGAPAVPLDMTTGFHTYGCYWASDFVTFYIDRVVTEIIPTPAGYATEPMYLILSTGIFGGSFNGPVNNAQLPCSMFVDYVAVWNKPPF